ncbi:MAG: sigma-70 family RNA polymerase sigma factor [Planctomycetes bacterium]|nr:sigma-70 family RNA polymerase sigma factor [Planctomycetota bacterium]
MDTSRLDELLRRHAGLIQKVAWAYCRDATDRTDVVQEIAVQLWRAHGRYDPRLRESTWVARIALNVAISFHRREERHRRHRAPQAEAPESSPQPIDPAAAGADAASRDEEAARLRGAIEKLGALDRALVLLHLEGHDHGEIAAALGITAGNVATKWWRIKERLRGALAPAARDAAHEAAGSPARAATNRGDDHGTR